MALTDWMGSFGRAQALDLSNDLERGYEAALLIQSASPGPPRPSC
jgi:hypothetical protein